MGKRYLDQGDIRFGSDGSQLHQRAITVFSCSTTRQGDLGGTVSLVGAIGDLALARDGNAAYAVVAVIGILNGIATTPGKKNIGVKPSFLTDLASYLFFGSFF